MKKIFLLGWKDLTLAFRDRAALVLMLLAPFALTLGLGLVTGNLSGGSSGISSIPVALVNQDEGVLGGELVKLFQSDGLADLVLPTLVSDPAAARLQVDEDQIAAVIIIPSDFTASLIPEGASGQGVSQAGIDLYLNPNLPTSAGIIQSIVEQFAYQAQVGQAGVEVVVSRLIQTGLLTPQQAGQAAAQLGAGLAQSRTGGA